MYLFENGYLAVVWGYSRMHGLSLPAQNTCTGAYLNMQRLLITRAAFPPPPTAFHILINSSSVPNQAASALKASPHLSDGAPSAYQQHIQHAHSDDVFAQELGHTNITPTYNFSGFVDKVS